MTTLREAAQQALEALEYYRTGEDYQPTPASEAITALRVALIEPVKAMNKTPAWWMDGLAATLMREGVNKHRAKEIAKGYWEAYCQVPMDEEQPR